MPRITYKELSDQQLVELIVSPPHNEEAAAHLLYDRYRPLLRHIYHSLMSDNEWYDDCVDELFLHLRGHDGEWRYLAGFQWRSPLGCWIKRVARHKFIEILPRLIENGGANLSLNADSDDSERVEWQLPDGGEEDYEARERKVMLLEAIGQLQDDDQRFVILKRLEGYNSNEIALLLRKRWQKHGISKLSHSKVREQSELAHSAEPQNGGMKSNTNRELVIPDAAYVDVRTQRAKANLRVIIARMK